MNFHLVYVCAGNVPGAPPPEHYHPGFLRFVRTLKEFKPSAWFQLVLVNSNNGLTDAMRDAVGMPFVEVKYSGMGWDVGAQQFAAQRLPQSDWMICFSSWAFFKRAGWLERYAEAISWWGDALYGSHASNENKPHIRGTGYCLKVLSYLQYPLFVDSRDTSFKAESGPDSLTDWFIDNKDGAYLVTHDGIYSREDFRKPDNIFRRGDQSNLLNHDKHSLIYDEADPAEKKRLEGISDA